MRSVKLVSAVAALALVGALGLAGCGSKDASNNAATGGASAAATDGAGDSASVEATNDSGGDAGFEEYPIGDDKEAEGQINVSLVYFQPVDMEPAGASGLKASDASFHMEADVSGLEGNTLGYGAGDFVPGLTVDYKIALKDGSGTPVTGTFMKMNASDGPHYGANIKLDQAGDYTVSVSIHSPEEDGWVLHVDPETGVKGRFWTQPIELQWDWKYTPQQW